MNTEDKLGYALLVLVVSVAVLGLIAVTLIYPTYEHTQRMKLFETDYGKCIDACGGRNFDEKGRFDCLQECKPLAACIRLLPG